MPEAFKRLASGTISTAEASTYTVPGSTSAIIKNITAVNILGVTATLTIRHGVAGLRLQKAVPVDAGGSLEFDGTLCMAAGEILTFQSDTASAFEVNIYGIEVT